MLHLVQFLLLLLPIVPFAFPFRWAPNPVFPSELIAFGLCGLLAIVAVPRAARSDWRWPTAAWGWPVLAVVILLQYALMGLPYLSLHLVPAAYLGMLALLALTLPALCAQYGRDEVVRALAWGLLTGALISSVIALPQVYDRLTTGHARVFGNVGQGNLYGHHLAWGLAALCWLTAKREFGRWGFFLLAAWLTLSLAWCGSRSVLLYALVWAVWAAIVLWRAHSEVTRSLARCLIAAAVLVFVAQFVAPLVGDVLSALAGTGGGKNNALERLNSNGARRLVEWQKAWQVFLAHPWWGTGWGTYPRYSVELHSGFAQVQESKLFTHSHSSLFNLLAETGLAGTLPILLLLGAMVLAAFRQLNDDTSVLMVALVVVSLLHSLVEYPLWYFHFLALFGVFSALLLAPRASEGPARRFGGLIALSGGALALYLVALGVQGYLTMYPLMNPSKNVGLNAARMKQLDQLRRAPWTDFYADFALSNYVMVSTSDLRWKRQVLDRLIAVRPYAAQLTRAATLAALDGDVARGRKLIGEAVYAYPAHVDWIRSVPAQFVIQHPKAMQPLLDEVDAAGRVVSAARK
ncbi:Wzy polymerase domain-containing protein [Chitinibacteraceae bacterium HSL-7]